MMFTAAEAITWTARLAGICCAVLSTEVLLDRRHYSDAGLLGWPVMQSRHRSLVASWYAPVFGLLLNYPAFLTQTLLRLASGLALALLGPHGTVGLVALTLALAAGLLFQLRSAFGTDGADQMNGLTLGALLLDQVCSSPRVRSAVLWFLALQLVLSYFIAGLAKFRGEEWRQGRAAWAIFSTRMYGAPPLGLWLKRHPKVSCALSWSVMVAETAYPVVLVAPAPVAVTILAAGLFFHGINAVLMGLNTFLWAFVAVYPALAWCVLSRQAG